MNKGWIGLKAIFMAVLVIVIGLISTHSSSAQEPACPPGFEWQRMSGVGCVQSNCPSIANAKYSYTQACICLDGFKACTQPVSYENFDGTLCGPNCPYSELLACVSPDAACPGEEINLVPTGEPSFSSTPPLIEDDGLIPGSVSGDDAGFDDFIQILESLIAGPATSTPTSGQEAAGAVVGSSLLAAWVLINMLSGGDLPGVLSQLFGGGGSGTGSIAQASQGISLPGLSSPGTQTGTAGTPPLQQSADTQLPTGSKQPANLENAHQLLQDKIHEIVKDKVREGYYVRNPTWYQQIWNNFPITSDIIETIRGLKGGQCGEFVQFGNDWIKNWAVQTFGPGTVVDSIWVGESSSRYPEGFLGAADALYQDNHTANRILLPNGESIVVDFWDAVIKYRDGGESALSNIKSVPEAEWVHKWRGAIETSGDPADVCNVNSLQESLRSHIASFDVKHPAYAASGSPERYLENQQLMEQAIQDWQKSNPQISPEVQQTIIRNWREHGAGWGMHRPKPPLDPASSVIEAGYGILDKLN